MWEKTLKKKSVFWLKQELEFFLQKDLHIFLIGFKVVEGSDVIQRLVSKQFKGEP